MRPRDLFRGPSESMGGGQGVPGGQGGHLRDPTVPTGWFDESPYDS